MLTGKTLDLDSYRTKLNLGVNFILEESTQLCNNIPNKNFTDDDIRQHNRNLLLLDAIDQLVEYKNKGKVRCTASEKCTLLRDEALNLVLCSKKELGIYETE
jgi:hypothetical protein